MGTIGRYNDLGRASTPGDLPRQTKATEHSHVRHGVVPDPNPSLRGKRQRAAINVKTDALEREYASGRISEAAYQAARTYQSVLERSRRPLSAGGQWSGGERVDHVVCHDTAILDRIDSAGAAVEMLRDTAPAIGMLGQRVLELVLVDELTLTTIATRMRGEGKQHVIYFSTLFRDSCEALANHWSRRDRRAPRA